MLSMMASGMYYESLVNKDCTSLADWCESPCTIPPKFQRHSLTHVGTAFPAPEKRLQSVEYIAVIVGISLSDKPPCWSSALFYDTFSGERGITVFFHTSQYINNSTSTYPHPVLMYEFQIHQKLSNDVIPKKSCSSLGK